MSEATQFDPTGRETPRELAAFLCGYLDSAGFDSDVEVIAKWLTDWQAKACADHQTATPPLSSLGLKDSTDDH